jgi:hypothetical protein
VVKFYRRERADTRTEARCSPLAVPALDMPPLLLLLLLAAVRSQNVALNAPVIGHFSGAPNSLTASPDPTLPGWNATSFAATPDHTLFPEFVTLDLGPQCFALREVVLWRPLPAAQTAACGFPTNFSVAVSDNQAAAWRDALEAALLPPPPPGGSLTLQLAPGTQGRYLRLRVTAVSPACAASAGLWLQLDRLQAVGSPTPCPGPSDASWLPTPWPPRCSPSVASLAVEGQPMLSPSASAAAPPAPEPAVADTAWPLFTFALRACERGQRATAFYLRVGTTPGGAELWDSGRVPFAPGAPGTSARYAGSPLPASSRLFASLVLFDVNGTATPATPTQLFFLTAKLSSNYSAPGVWDGAWLGTGASGSGAHRGLYLRSSFSLPPGRVVGGAVATFSLLGYGELYIDGHKVGQALLAPGWTQYNKRTQYLTVDVTAALQQAQAEVALAVLLGDGWYSISADCWVHHLERAVYVSAPKALLDITVSFTDGSRQVFGSSAAAGAPPWVWSYGAITRAWIGAEDVDENLALPGNWTLGGTPAAGTLGWQAAVAVAGPPQQFPGALLVSQVEAPTRVQELLAWQTHSASNASATPYIGGGRFEMNSSHSSMLFWVPQGGALKYQLDPGACRPCPSVDACGSVVQVPQQALDRLALAPSNFSCSLLPTTGGNATSHVFFFGREFQGWPRVAVSSYSSSSSCSPLNLTILICGSRDGDCNAASQPAEMGGPDASHYTLAAGACSGVWEPHFMYSSVRTVVVTLRGAGAGEAALDVTGVRVAMDAPSTSSFDSSEERYNWMHRAVARTQENYITAFPNDPTREKKGWTQDIMCVNAGCRQAAGVALLHALLRLTHPPPTPSPPHHPNTLSSGRWAQRPCSCTAAPRACTRAGCRTSLTARRPLGSCQRWRPGLSSTTATTGPGGVAWASLAPGFSTPSLATLHPWRATTLPCGPTRSFSMPLPRLTAAATSPGAWGTGCPSSPAARKTAPPLTRQPWPFMRTWCPRQRSCWAQRAGTPPFSPPSRLQCLLPTWRGASTPALGLWARGSSARRPWPWGCTQTFSPRSTAQQWRRRCWRALPATAQP